MKMRFAMRDLLKQMPSQIRVWMIGADDIPDYVELDVETIGERVRYDNEAQAIIERYRSAYQSLTPKQWRLFQAIARPGGATLTALCEVIGVPETRRNSVSVLMYDMRKVFVKKQLPYQIVKSSEPRYVARYRVRAIESPPSVVVVEDAKSPV